MLEETYNGIRGFSLAGAEAHEVASLLLTWGEVKRGRVDKADEQGGGELEVHID